MAFHTIQQFCKKYSQIFRYSVFGVFVAWTIGIGALLLNQTAEVRYYLLQQPLAQHFVHSYHSLRKIPDIFFIPYLFAHDSLPTYRLDISLDNLERLNERLPKNALAGKLEEENKLWVGADFTDLQSGYSTRVKVKYRGLNALHWNSLKKSLRIEFPDDAYWHGQRLVNFLIPYDRDYFAEPLNMYRAQKLGLLDTDMHFSRLIINGKDAGVYLTFEHFSPEWVAKKGLPEAPLFGLRDGNIDIARGIADYINMFDKEDEVSKEPLVALLTLLHEADDSTFQKLIPHLFDLDAYARWNVLAALAGSNHQSIVQNTVLYFNPATGLFELVPWDIGIIDQDSESQYREDSTYLAERLLAIPSFRHHRDTVLREYLESNEQQEDDLRFYDMLASNTKNSFFKDTQKLYNNLTYRARVKEIRTLVIENWERAWELLDGRSDLVTPIVTTKKETPDFSGSFILFPQITESINTFLRQHPEAYMVDPNTIGFAGVIILKDDIIIPEGYSVVIAPGTRIRMAGEVSFISYSPIVLSGTVHAPISIERFSESKPWGVFAVVNTATAGTSTVSYTRVSGGSQAYINGITFSGMMAFHNSNVLIQNSRFYNAGGDDALNVKNATGMVENSYFESSVSDALDVDLGYNFSIRGNRFVDQGGDAIDISFSDSFIEDNVITECVDKGISIGERSKPTVVQNTIQRCAIGVAVKDQSHARIVDNLFIHNRTGVSLYQKKPVFGGATAELIENTFIDNEVETLVGSVSAVEIF